MRGLSIMFLLFSVKLFTSCPSLVFRNFDQIELKIQTLVNSRVTNVDVQDKKRLYDEKPVEK